MFLELIAAFFAGAGAAGIVLILNLITGGRLPKWVMPVAAGGAMIAFGVFSEYSWGERTADGLPEGVVVIDRVDESSWYKPWSFLFPVTVRLVTVDTRSVQTNDAAPGVQLVELYLFQRWQPPAQVSQLLRCEDTMQASVPEGVLQNPATAKWHDADPNLSGTICKE